MTYSVAAIAGSLRRESYNRALVRAAQETAPVRMTIELVELKDVPLLNTDLEVEGVPPAVNELRERLGRADGLLIATPEHNGTVSAVTKNALEWASRHNPHYAEYGGDLSPLAGKPVAIMGASTGHFATIRAQAHLLYLCSILQMKPMSRPHVMIDNAREKFDDGRLIDEPTLRRLSGFLDAFAAWIAENAS